MYPDTCLYPAVFEYSEAGISVTFPDLDGCVAFGADEADALNHAREGLALHLCGMEQDGEPLPSPTRTAAITVGTCSAIVLVDAYMPLARAQQSERLVKKTLTIPEWLNIAAERQHINFSQLLQTALKNKLGVG